VISHGYSLHCFGSAMTFRPTVPELCPFGSEACSRT